MAKVVKNPNQTAASGIERSTRNASCGGSSRQIRVTSRAQNNQWLPGLLERRAQVIELRLILHLAEAQMSRKAGWEARRVIAIRGHGQQARLEAAQRLSRLGCKPQRVALPSMVKDPQLTQRDFEGSNPAARLLKGGGQLVVRRFDLLCACFSPVMTFQRRKWRSYCRRMAWIKLEHC